MLAVESGAGHLRGSPEDETVQAIRSAVQVIPMAALAHTTTFEIVAANDQCATLLQIPRQQIQGRMVRDLVPLVDRATAEQTARDLLDAAPKTDGTPITTSSLRRLVLGDNTVVTCWMHVGLTTIRSEQVFIVCMDLVEPVLTDAHRWRQRADYDELTGLLRRGPLMDSVREWLLQGEQVAVAFLDVDGLKAVNDTYGHAAGDQVLSALSRRLEQLAPPGSLVARLSGDEFVIASTQPPTDDSQSVAPALWSAAARCAAEPIPWADHLLRVAVSTGVVVSRAGEKPVTLVARADTAMYLVKSARRAARSAAESQSA